MDRLSRKDMVLQMLEKEPKDLFLNYALAMELVGIDDYQNAELQLQKTLSLDNQYLPCYYQLGQVLEKLNNNDQAISFYKQGIELAKTQGNTKAIGELNEALWMLEED
jgi:tetratricopeptide (TPR) repeat protein